MTTQTLAAWLTGRRTKSLADDSAGTYTLELSGVARQKLEAVARARRVSLRTLVLQALVLAIWLDEKSADGANLELVLPDGTRTVVKVDGITDKPSWWRLFA